MQTRERMSEVENYSSDNFSGLCRQITWEWVSSPQKYGIQSGLIKKSGINLNLWAIWRWRECGKKKMSRRLISLLEVKSEPCQAISHEFICTGAWAFASGGYNWGCDNPFLSLRLLTNTHTHFWLPESCSCDNSTAVFWGGGREKEVRAGSFDQHKERVTVTRRQHGKGGKRQQHAC